MGGVLVTGGAGYIGSHVVRQLGERGEPVVVLDDLSTGRAGAVLHGDLVLGDAGDTALVRELLEDHQLDAVMHFAARTVVPESVSDPLMYYGENSCKTRALAGAALQAGVRHFIFSSSAAVYGIPDHIPVAEDDPLYPINPYGTSKLVSEWMLRDTASSGPLRHVSLRYFNVAGADPEGRIGQSTPEATLLIKVACEAATGQRDLVPIYGNDYPTPDGTGVRDFIHVEDLAAAHIRCLDYLRGGGASTTFNVGYGHGYSVREVLDTVERVSGSQLPVREEDRRPGDPPALVANTERIRRELGWRPGHDDLEEIVSTALAWERKRCEAWA
ncbi:UDP-glucose 4-epimerase [Thiohalorhabdus denitrificans]|uniref:UDP-glucose 4-epimerase n=1 Tax=Thiohalorhabdus denitrificans TaxID=381306 RepID=A0A0P9ENF9_9GAMM|nr:UDP-glucose 4-epimerase GalE [Thiohalorhabdus denitrificans]KPV40035.1 UDP-glucose 4-epimerase [Thiohalorhabdus denitrificans]SCY13174.1 UDP-galactose 4-epimerase [Thiohalorhabdus denitrificans]